MLVLAGRAFRSEASAAGAPTARAACDEHPGDEGGMILRQTLWTGTYHSRAEFWQLAEADAAKLGNLQDTVQTLSSAVQEKACPKA